MNILIIDDNKDIIDFLKPNLKAQGFVVDTAEDGEKGLYKCQINDYDVVVLDMNLPKKDGLQICAEIRKSKNPTPIIMLSVRSEIGIKANLINAGADDYLTKPFSFEELMARIRALLRRPHAIMGEVLNIEGIVLDSNSRTIICDGKKIHVTPKEFHLLEYLMRNRGKVLSRMAILEHVWDTDADLFTNTIETHIASLRKKLKQKNKRDLIHTVSSAGYKID